jgi:MarR family transcriptional regulator, organic hydroperoxide resistance regulator
MNPTESSTTSSQVEAGATTALQLGPDNWLAAEVGRTDPGSEAWSLLHWLMVSNKPRMLALSQEFDLPLQGLIALRILGAGPRPMGELARILACDSSNMTAITDRLEERGLAQRAPDEKDRRVKLLVLTGEGERVREEITKRLAEPPPAIAALSRDDQRTLRDIIRRGIDRAGEQG